MTEGGHTLTATGVADLFGNIVNGVECEFEYDDYSYPTGYYDDAAGLCGEELQAALRDIIKGHIVHSYSFAWTAFYFAAGPSVVLWDGHLSGSA